METRCAWDAELRFESDIFNSLNVFALEEDPSFMRRADGTNPFSHAGGSSIWQSA